MIKQALVLIGLGSLTLLMGCATVGSLAGASIAKKTGNNILGGSLIGGAIGKMAGQVATGSSRQVR